ncbi:hypothetical protein P0D72_06895 [Paraburkholderia sediminicola]
MTWLGVAYNILYMKGGYGAAKRNSLDGLQLSRFTRLSRRATTRFTIDTLVEMMSRIGKPVTLAVG